MQHQGSFTIDEWCKHRRVSRPMLYKMWGEGGGPRFYFNGTRRYISAEADADWLAQREAQAVVEAA